MWIRYAKDRSWNSINVQIVALNMTIRTITTMRITVVQAIHMTTARVIQVLALLEAQEEKEMLTTHVTVNLIWNGTNQWKNGSIGGNGKFGINAQKLVIKVSKTDI